MSKSSTQAGLAGAATALRVRGRAVWVFDLSTPGVQDVLSYCRLVKPTPESAGKINLYRIFSNVRYEDVRQS